MSKQHAEHEKEVTVEHHKVVHAEVAVAETKQVKVPQTWEAEVHDRLADLEARLDKLEGKHGHKPAH